MKMYFSVRFIVAYNTVLLYHGIIQYYFPDKAVFISKKKTLGIGISGAISLISIPIPLINGIF